MDFEGEPSRFLEYDVDMSGILSLCSRAVSRPSWQRQQHCFDDNFDVSLLIGSDDDVSLGLRHISESRTQPAAGTSGTGRRLPHGAKSVRLRPNTWSYVSSKPTALQPEYIVVQQEPTAERDDSYLATFTGGQESKETENCLVARSSSSPQFFLDSAQLCKLGSSTEDRQLVDLVRAHTADYRVMLSAVSGRRGDSGDDNNDDRFRREDHSDDAQSSLTQTPQLESSAIPQQQQQHEERKLFGLPGRITVSKREINMMSPLSF